MLVFQILEFKALIGSVVFVLTFACSAQAKAWRDIIPLHSNRADVERLLGPPSSNNGDTVVYEYPSERASIEYSKGPCTVEYSPWNVPRYTVISIWVTPKLNQLNAATLNLNQKNYSKFRDNHRPQIVQYINETEGIEYSVDEETGNVVLIKYVPSAADKSLKCPEPRDRLYEPVQFAKYSNISFAAEKKILDKFAAQLVRYTSTNYASAEGHILAYGRNQGPEAKNRAQRAKEYLVNVHHISAARIEIRDACCRQRLNIELYLVPPGVTPPRLAP